ncbi:MAG: hypothetical protein M1834_009499 [Cirrosporium novae-zelandiae]|nr:MAG: hypothetical protein M1834_009499 [Cirrosporium novae-zelandiae]
MRPYRQFCYSILAILSSHYQARGTLYASNQPYIPCVNVTAWKVSISYTTNYASQPSPNGLTENQPGNLWLSLGLFIGLIWKEIDNPLEEHAKEVLSGGYRCSFLETLAPPSFYDIDVWQDICAPIRGMLSRSISVCSSKVTEKNLTIGSSTESISSESSTSSSSDSTCLAPSSIETATLTITNLPTLSSIYDELHQNPWTSLYLPALEPTAKSLLHIQSAISTKIIDNTCESLPSTSSGSTEIKRTRTSILNEFFRRFTKRSSHVPTAEDTHARFGHRPGQWVMFGLREKPGTKTKKNKKGFIKQNYFPALR